MMGCAAMGYRYMGLQYAGECWCGNSYGRYGVETRGCNNCNINIGGWRNCVFEVHTSPEPRMPL